jgi:hypothetical protein
MTTAWLEMAVTIDPVAAKEVLALPDGVERTASAAVGHANDSACEKRRKLFARW